MDMKRIKAEERARYQARKEIKEQEESDQRWGCFVIAIIMFIIGSILEALSHY